MARRFQFRLETVRRLRRRAQDAQQRVVADAISAANQVAQQRQRWERDLNTTIAESRYAQMSARIDLTVLRCQQRHRGWLRQMIDTTSMELAKHRARLDEERAKLAEVSKALKVIEKLRERQWRRHLTAMRREEQAASDEAAVQMFLRRRVGARTVGEVAA